ncbi:MAG: twin-arginine translocase subunit TatC [Dehalococcoidia bacterium]
MTFPAPPEPAATTSEEIEGGKYMTILEHVQELRNRLFIASVAVVAGLAVTAFFGQQIIEFLKEPGEATGKLQLQFIEPFELFVTYFRVSLLGGLTLAMPVIVYQALMFVSPGLTRQERRWLYSAVAGATLLFLGGAAFAYYIALPPALDFLFNFGSGLDVEANIRIGSYIDFVTRLIFWTGVTFETPLLVMFLARFGIVTARQLLRWWRLAVVIAFVVAAIVTPTIDPVTQSLVAGPIVVLYFLGIGLAWLVQPRRTA